MRDPGDPADIAAAVAVPTAAHPVPGAYSITGPERLSVRDQIAVINATLGRAHPPAGGIEGAAFVVCRIRENQAPHAPAHKTWADRTGTLAAS